MDETRGIAIVNDPGLGFALLNAYVDIPKQISALQQFGLTTIETVGRHKTSPGYDAQDEWVYILARKDG
jgi:hypothetical protein